MNKIWLWILNFFVSPKPLAQRIKEIGISIEDKPLTDKQFLFELKKAKKEATEPALSEELRVSIQQKLGKLLASSYKKALIGKSDVIFIAEHEAKKAGIVLSGEDGWLNAKTHMVNYLNSLGIKAGFYSEYIDVRAGDVSRVVDCLPDSFMTEEEELDHDPTPPHSVGIYR